MPMKRDQLSLTHFALNTRTGWQLSRPVMCQSNVPVTAQLLTLSTVDPHVEEAKHGCEHRMIRVYRGGQALDHRHALL